MVIDRQSEANLRGTGVGAICNRPPGGGLWLVHSGSSIGKTSGETTAGGMESRDPLGCLSVASSGRVLILPKLSLS